jgi:hypothetical protein
MELSKELKVAEVALMQEHLLQLRQRKTPQQLMTLMKNHSRKIRKYYAS